MNNWSLTARYMPRPHAAAEAWVYEISRNGRPWGTLVDERIRYKTLFEPGRDIHPDLDEVIVPLDGRYWVKTGSWARTLVPGEAALIPRGTEHDSGTATNLVGTRFLVMLFNAKEPVLPMPPGGVELPSGALAWLKGAFRFLRSRPTVDGFLPLSVLPQFFQHAPQWKQLPGDRSHPDPVAAELIRLLEQPDTPTLEELAQTVALSPAHLQRRFKQAIGFSPLQYANAWKLNALARRLEAGDTLPLVELAAEFGFNDMKHFRTLFMRRFGKPPSAYRKNPPPRK